jgi:hypothetical protein
MPQRSAKEQLVHYKVGCNITMIIEVRFWKCSMLLSMKCGYFDMSSFYTPVLRRDVLSYGVVHLSVRGHFSFPDFFFAIFAATALKLGLLLCSIELLYSSNSHFSMIDSLLQELMPLELRRIE